MSGELKYCGIVVDRGVKREKWQGEEVPRVYDDEVERPTDAFIRILKARNCKGELRRMMW